MRVLTHDKNKTNQQSWAFGVPWSPGFALGPPPRGGFWKQSKWPSCTIHSMPCRNPHRPYIRLASTYSVGPSKRSVKRRTWTGSAFATNERSRSVIWSWAHNLMWEVALRLHRSTSSDTKHVGHRIGHVYMGPKSRVSNPIWEGRKCPFKDPNTLPYTLPTLADVGHQWTIPTSMGALLELF